MNNSSFIKIPILLIVFIALASFRIHYNGIQISSIGKQYHGSGAPAGKTGAPGEGTCIDCHSVSTLFEGSNENQLTMINGSSEVVTTYTPGETYTLELIQVTNIGGTGGFEITGLDNTATKAGTFTANLTFETKKLASGGREWITHTNNTPPEPWKWTWTAPVTNVGPITFYIASNKSNGTSSHFGDEIHLSQVEYIAIDDVGLTELENTGANFSAYYVPLTNDLKLNFTKEEVGKMAINVVDMNGKSVYAQKLGNSISGENNKSIQLPSAIKSGVYFVNFFVDNTPMTSKVMISK